MAFPIPTHLPRKAAPPDVSTQILTKVSEATSKTLSASLAKSWVSELDASIQQTKGQIHERIHEDLPVFDRYLDTSKSVQERLRSLTRNVDELDHMLSAPNSGLIPSLLKALNAHSELTRRALDARTQHLALSHLQFCKRLYMQLSSLVDDGLLVDATRVSAELEQAMFDAPPAIRQAVIFQGLQARVRSVKDRLEEQLSDAYSRAVILSSSEIILRPHVDVRQSAATITLPSILASLPPRALTSHLSTLRRDLTTHYIERTFKQPLDVMVSVQDGKAHLTASPAPPNAKASFRLIAATHILDFLNNHLFHHLPESHKASFPPSLSRPITTSLLNNLLVPSLPSSSADLPAFLDLVQRSTVFERDYVEGILHDDQDGQIKTWAADVANHYEKKRRVDILEKAREVIVGSSPSATFSVEFLIRTEASAVPSLPTIVPVQGDEPVVEDAHNTWSFDDDAPKAAIGKSLAEDHNEPDAWGFEDGAEAEPPVNGVNGHSHTNGQAHDAPPPSKPIVPPASSDPDPDAAWGWNEDDAGDTTGDSTDDSSAWDDAWDESLADPPSPAPAPSPPISAPEPKRATRLEKLAQKGKASASPSPIPSPAPFHPAPTPPPPAPSVNAKHKPPPVEKPITVPSIVREHYVVSQLTKEVLTLVEETLREGQELSLSSLLPSSPGSQSSPGTLIVQASATILDLYRSVYPVALSGGLAASAAKSMRFANDAAYLSEEVEKVVARDEPGLQTVRARMVECKEMLKALSEGWYEDEIDKREDAVFDILAEADGFADTAEQERFDECENAVGRVLREIRSVAQGWKTVLARSKYFVSVGALVESALARILEDVLALEDIPEVESHRLAELCRILNALEGLFIDEPEQPSLVVAYVPSWLKFSYLSELLEASMADLTYLFEEGALVDFEVEELVKLVRGLFADTPLRMTTINKIMEGHPVKS